MPRTAKAKVWWCIWKNFATTEEADLHHQKTLLYWQQKQEDQMLLAQLSFLDEPLGVFYGEDVEECKTLQLQIG